MHKATQRHNLSAQIVINEDRFWEPWDKRTVPWAKWKDKKPYSRTFQLQKWERETKRLSKRKKRLHNDDKSKRVKNTQEWASTISFQLFSPRNSIQYTDNFIKFYLFCRSFVDKLTNKININVNFGWFWCSVWFCRAFHESLWCCG